MTAAITWNQNRIESCDSTNNHLKAGLAAGTYHIGDVVITKVQTKGRGRMDRTWASPAGNLAFSCAIPLPPGGFEHAYQLTLVAGLSLTRTLAELIVSKKEVSQKWPNDVLVGGRKVAGILSEIEGKAAVIGIGVNWNSQLADFPTELKSMLTTVRDVTGKTQDDEVFFAAFLPRFAADLERYNKNGLAVLLPEIEQQLAYRERVVTIIDNGKKWAVTILGLNADGHLKFRMADGTVRELISCEIIAT